MGLTAAEAFMLICFILLLLLGLWRESTREATQFYEQFTPNQRAAAEVYQAELENLGRNMNELKSFQDLVAEAGGEQRLREALKMLRSYPNLPPDEVIERVRLLNEAELKVIAEASAKLPKEVQRRLADLATTEQFSALIEVAHASPEEFVESAKRFQEYEATGLSPDEVKLLAFEAADTASLSDELAEYTSIGVNAEEMRRLVQSLDELRQAQLLSGKNIADAIRERAGELIAEMGGSILDNGDVVFPESVLFDPGKDAIKPKFDRVLSRFCVPWLESLNAFDDSLRNIQIEGHASSEWNNELPRVAFRKNLDLSQRRAANVYKRCLDFARGTPLEGWAQSRLAAVGYSSSRPVRDGAGSEDRTRSRRVVFALDLKTLDDLTVERLTALPKEARIKPETSIAAPEFTAAMMNQVSELPTKSFYEGAGYRPVQGVISRAVDGDTLLLGNERIRLEGLHAPERFEEAGKRAKAFMEKNFVGSQAECWISGEHTFDRDVGVCYVGDRDIAGALIVAGLGRDCPSFSAGRYRALEQPLAVQSLPLPGYCQ